MPHINNTSLKSSKIFESTIGHNVYVYGDSSTQEWLNNIVSASGQTNLIYKPISDYKLSITSNTDINAQVGYNGSFTFTNNKNVNAYYTYTTNGTTYIIGNVDIEKNGNTYTINNIKSNIYIEVE